MKPIILSKQSWHYRLLKKTKFLPWSDTDLCGYTWRVIFMCFGLTLASILGVWCIASVADVTVWVSVMIWYGVLLEPSVVAAPFFLMVILAGLFGGLWLADKRREKPQSEPGFVAMAYRSIKDRVCFSVEFR